MIFLFQIPVRASKHNFTVYEKCNNKFKKIEKIKRQKIIDYEEFINNEAKFFFDQHLKGNYAFQKWGGGCFGPNARKNIGNTGSTMQCYSHV